MTLFVRDLRFERESFSVSVPQLRVDEGQLCVLVGKSGSGKTTLLHLVAGFLKAKGGSIHWKEQSIDSLPPERRRIALLLQGGALFPHLTVRQNVEFSPRVQKLASVEIAARANRFLSELQISELEGRYPNQISGGQAQRVALARALASGFPILLLDEPFSSLDDELRESLYPILKKLCRAENVAMLLVTHGKKDVLALADCVYEVREGVVFPRGTQANT